MHYISCLAQTLAQLGSPQSDTTRRISEWVAAETMGRGDDHRPSDDLGASTAGIVSNDLSPVSSDRRTGGGSQGTDSNNGTVRVVEPGEHSTNRASGNNGLGNRDLQAPYEPFSKGKRLGGLVPVNMQGTVQKTLSNLVDRVTQEEGINDIDDWVLKKLNDKAPNAKLDSGEWTKERLFDALGAEQIDSVALGIYNFDHNTEFIIGDETGFGKTRQLAALTVYGMQQGFTPVYVTKDEDLYKDVLGGFDEIGVEGVNAFATNTPTMGKKAHQLELEEILASGDLGERNMVLTTYSQMLSVKGKETERRNLLREIVASDGMLVMDECHIAGGGKATIKELEAGKPPNGAMFARELKHKAGRTLSASATFAKFPEVMDLYSRTDMVQAVAQPEALVDLISKGGRGLQEILSNQLTEAGQYLRRERPFQAEFTTVKLEVDRDICDDESKVMDAIVQFDQAKKDSVKDISFELKAEAKRINPDNSTGGAGVDSTNFTSLMHNYLNVSNLAKKIEQAVEFACECLERGEKPCIGIASTQESVIKGYAQYHDIQPGDQIDISFKDMLRHYADRSREIGTRDAYGNYERRHLTDEEIAREGRIAWDNIQEAIEDLDTSGWPISPIDMFRTQMQERGYTVGEITGRSSGIDYVKQEDGSYEAYYKTFKSLRNSEIKRATTDGFNNGEIDCLIGNQSMSTGISLHASEKFTDQRQRHFLLLQPEGDINKAKQFLGRFDRTGQVNAPKITIGAADIPYERRMQSILMGKLAGLSANTTANRESQVDFGESRDFLNRYGDQIAEEVLKDNPELNYRLNSPYDEEREYNEGELIKKLTGRLPILSIDEQEDVMQQIETGYDTLMEELDALGINTLKTTTLDLDAVTLSTVEVVPATGMGDTPFAAPVIMDILDVKSGRKPYTSEQVFNRVRQELGLDTLEGDTSVQPINLQNPRIRRASSHHAIKQISELEKVKENYQQDRQNLFKTQSSLENFLETTNRQAAVVTGMRRAFSVGTPVQIETPEGSEIYGVVLAHAIKSPDKNGNPLRLSNHQIQIAVADGAKELDLAYSKFGSTAGKYLIKPQYLVDEDGEEKPILQLFDEAQNADREQRYMMTGNLLKAADQFGNQGKIVHYTDRAGDRHPGFLMKKCFEPIRDLANAPVRLTEVEHIANLTQEQRLSLHTRDARLSLVYDNEEQVYEISVPKSKKAGGEFFLDKKLLDAATAEGAERNEFYSRGDSSYLYFSPNELEFVVERLDEKWGLYAVGKEDAAVARELVGLEIPDLEEILAKALEVQQELRELEDVELDVNSPTLSVIDGGKLPITSETETVEITNSPQAESEVEADITQNSGIETVEIRKLESQNSEQATTDSTVPEASPGEVEFLNSQEDLQEKPVEILESQQPDEIEIEQSELIQQQRVQIVAPITNELLKFVGEDRYEGSQNIAYRKDDTLNIETLEHRHLMVARWDQTSRNWHNINSNLSDEDVSHFQSIHAVLVQRIEELEHNKQQQEFVGRLAPLIADYHDLASEGEKANLGYYSTGWNAEKQILTLTDEEKGEEILTAQLTDNGWKNIDSQLSSWQVDELENEIMSTLDVNTEKLQAKRFEAIQPVVAEVLRQNQTNHLEGSQHTARWDKSSQTLTAWKNGDSEPFLSARWSGDSGWQDTGENVISFETAHHFWEQIIPKLERHSTQSKITELHH